MAEACVLSSHIAFHSHVFRRHAAGSNPAAGAWPDRQRRPHPRFVQLSWGVGTMGAIICCHGAQRPGSYQSISYQSRSREEPMKEILPHWRFGPNSPVKDVDEKRMTRGDRAVAEACRRAMESETWKELVILESGRALHRTGGPVRVRGRVSRVGGDAWRRFPSGSEGSVDAHGEDQGWWRDHPHHQDSRRER